MRLNLFALRVIHELEGKVYIDNQAAFMDKIILMAIELGLVEVNDNNWRVVATPLGKGEPDPESE